MILETQREHQGCCRSNNIESQIIKGEDFVAIWVFNKLKAFKSILIKNSLLMDVIICKGWHVVKGLFSMIGSIIENVLRSYSVNSDYNGSMTHGILMIKWLNTCKLQSFGYM